MEYNYILAYLTFSRQIIRKNLLISLVILKFMYKLFPRHYNHYIILIILQLSLCSYTIC